MIHPELLWGELIYKELESDFSDVKWGKVIEATEKISKFLLKQKDFDYHYFAAMLEIILSKISIAFPEKIGFFLVLDVMKKYSDMNPDIHSFLTYHEERHPEFMDLFNEILEGNRDWYDISEEKPIQE